MTGRDALLPWPDGDPASSVRIAGQLALVAARVDDTAVTREGGRGWGLARSWSGPAFEAARAEAAVVASRSADFGSALRPVVTALQAYAAALTEARRRIDALREEWDRGARHREQARHEASVSIADPTLLGMTLATAQRAADREWDRLQAELRGRQTMGRSDLRAGDFGLGADHLSPWGGVFADLVRRGYACHAGRASEGRFVAREVWLPDLAWEPRGYDAANLTALRRYIRGWLDAELMNSADGRPRKAGASQGSVLSPLLANIYLHPLDGACLLYTSPSPRDRTRSRIPSSACKTKTEQSTLAHSCTEPITNDGCRHDM